MKKFTAVGYIWTSPNTTNANEIVKEKRQKIGEYCSENNIIFKKLFKDIGATGSVISRPQMMEMLNYMKENKIDFLILDTLFNLGRRFHDAVLVLNEFRQNESSLISIQEDINTKTEDGKMIINALFRIPQLEQWTKKATQEQKKRAKEILYNGGACPYGYMIDEQSNQYKIIEVESLIVKRIFRERASGRSLRQIAKDLSKDSIATKRGGRWQANTIKTILENPFYIGIYVYNDIVYRDCHDAIINEYTFCQINEQNQKLISIVKNSQNTPSE